MRVLGPGVERRAGSSPVARTSILTRKMPSGRDRRTEPGQVPTGCARRLGSDYKMGFDARASIATRVDDSQKLGTWLFHVLVSRRCDLPDDGSAECRAVLDSSSIRSSTFDWSLASSEPYHAANSSVPETSHTPNSIRRWDYSHQGIDRNGRDAPDVNMDGCRVTKQRRER
jgi:hypothetical protein